MFFPKLIKNRPFLTKVWIIWRIRNDSIWNERLMRDSETDDPDQENSHNEWMLQHQNPPLWGRMKHKCAVILGDYQHPSSAEISPDSGRMSVLFHRSTGEVWNHHDAHIRSASAHRAAGAPPGGEGHPHAGARRQPGPRSDPKMWNRPDGESERSDGGRPESGRPESGVEKLLWNSSQQLPLYPRIW